MGSFHTRTIMLNPEELQLLRELASGRSDARIANRLDTSDRTVRRRVADLQSRFRVPGRFALGVLIGQLGIVKIESMAARPPQQPSES